MTTLLLPLLLLLLLHRSASSAVAAAAAAAAAAASAAAEPRQLDHQQHPAHHGGHRGHRGRYMPVGNTTGTKGFIHYWFIESQNNPATDPVVYWTNGGPGGSGINAG